MIEAYTLCHKLPSDALWALQRYFKNIANGFRTAAEIAENQEQKKRNFDVREKTIIDAEGMILTYLQTGLSPDSVLAMVGDMTGLEPEALQTILPRVKNHTLKQHRNQKIVTLHGQGRTLTEIGEAVQLHPKSVSRIIRKSRAA